MKKFALIYDDLLEIYSRLWGGFLPLFHKNTEIEIFFASA